MAAYHNTAVVFRDIKQALLFYKHVIPLDCSIMLENEEIIKNGFANIADPGSIANYCLDILDVDNLLPSHLRKNESFNNKLGHLVLSDMMTQLVINEAARERYKLSGLRCLKPLSDNFRVFINEFQLKKAMIDCPIYFRINGGAFAESPSLTFAGLKVIDTDQTPMEQITAFRKDKKAMLKMQKFRLFAYDNYTSKDKAYVEDDIQKRLADYNEAVKSWGFETKLKSLSFVLESKLLPTCLAASFLSALFGSTTEAIAAASTGVSIEIGRFTLELAKQKHELRKICRENPISYIADAKEKLEFKSA